MHGVVDRLDDVQDGGQSLLKFGCSVSFAALQHLLENERQRHRERKGEGELKKKHEEKEHEDGLRRSSGKYFFDGRSD